MSLVDDWKHGAAMIEVWAARTADDGFVVVFEGHGPEHAADLDQAVEQPVTWLGRYAQRDETWRQDLEAEIASRLAAWRAP